MWNSGLESDKEIVRARKRKTSFVSNVLVVSDPKNPENEGKVVLFRYGKKIFDKIKDAMSPPPEFVDEKPMNPFDLENGANFKLKIRKVEGYANFDKSEFEKPSPVYSEYDVKEIMASLGDIDQFVDPSRFKSYDELQRKLDSVLGDGGFSQPKRANKTPKVENYDDDEDKDEVPANKQTKKVESTSSDDDDLDYFRKLAAGGEDDDIPF